MRYEKPVVMDLGSRARRSKGQHPLGCWSGGAASGTGNACATGTGAGYSCFTGSGPGSGFNPCLGGNSPGSGDCVSGNGAGDGLCVTGPVPYTHGDPYYGCTTGPAP
jgi:hypothetical protein